MDPVEVKAAAKRVRASLKACGLHDQAYSQRGNGSWSQYQDDLKTLADAYLAEHPEDNTPNLSPERSENKGNDTYPDATLPK